MGPHEVKIVWPRYKSLYEGGSYPSLFLEARSRMNFIFLAIVLVGLLARGVESLLQLMTRTSSISTRCGQSNLVLNAQDDGGMQLEENDVGVELIPLEAIDSRRRITWRAGVRSQARVKESKRSAEEYMALPASQYSVLSANQIERLSDSQFKAKLGRLNFFGNDFIPILYVDVDVIPNESRAEIVVKKAETTGSEIAEKISGTFDIFAKNDVSSGVDKKGRKVLISDTKLSIEVTVPEESKVPLRLINSGGNFIIQQSLNVIVPTFIRLLAFDFKRWSAGEDSREAIEGASLN